MIAKRLPSFFDQFGRYGTGSLDASGNRRPAEPEIWYGYPIGFDKICADLFQTQPRYDSYTFSFSENYDEVGEAKIRQIMREFERVWFPCLDVRDLVRCWILHRRKKGFDLHFGVGRTDLKSGRPVELYNISSSDPELLSRFSTAISLKHGLSDPNDPKRVDLIGKSPRGQSPADRETWDAWNETAAAYYETGDARSRDELLVAFRKDGIDARALTKTSIILVYDNQQRTIKLVGPKYSVGFTYPFSNAHQPLTGHDGKGQGGVEVHSNRVDDSSSRLDELTKERAERQRRAYDDTELSYRYITKGCRLRRKNSELGPSARQSVRFSFRRNFSVEGPSERDPHGSAPVVATTPSGSDLENLGEDMPVQKGSFPVRMGTVPLVISTGGKARLQLVVGCGRILWGGGDGRDDQVQSLVTTPRILSGDLLEVVVPRAHHDEGLLEQDATEGERWCLTHAQLGTNFVSKIYEQISRIIKQRRKQRLQFARETAARIGKIHRGARDTTQYIDELSRRVSESMASGNPKAGIGRKELSFARIGREIEKRNDPALSRNDRERKGIEHGNVGKSGIAPKVENSGAIVARVLNQLSQLQNQLKQPLVKKNPEVICPYLPF